MSSITSGVKIGLWPSRLRPCGAFSSSIATPLEDELALGRFERVVVVELLATDELRQRRRRAEAVDTELALHELGVGVGPLALDAVDPQRGDLATDVDLAVVHRVAEAVADVAADDLAAPLHHESGHRAGVAADDDRPALLVDAGPGADLPLDHDVAAAQRGAGERAGVALDDDDAGHHVLRHRPADAPVDLDLRPVDHAAAEVAEAAFEGDPAPGEDADRQRVTGAGLQDGDVGDALLVEQRAQLEIDLANRQITRVEARGGSVDLRDMGGGVIELDQPPGVELPGPAVGLSYLLHTITWLS